MPLEIIGMFGSASGSTDALAQIDVPQDGVLRGIDWDVSAHMDADAESIDVELSFIATNQLAVNDTRGRISSVGSILTVTTSGSPISTMQKFISGMELMLHGGERLYTHVVATSGLTAAVRCNLHFDGGATVVRRSARR